MKQTLRALLIPAILFLAGLWHLTEVSDAIAEEPQTVRIGIAVPGAAVYANVDAAEKLGLYEKNGIKAEITAYRGGSAAQQAMAAGEADMISFFPAGVALAVKKGIEAKIVGAEMSTPVGWQIVSTKDSGIATVQDLAGKKVGVSSKGSTTDFYAMSVLKQAGVDAETVPVGGGSSRMAALVAGDVDAIVASPTTIFKMEAITEPQTLVDLGEALGKSLPMVWVATDSFIEDHPDLVAGTMRATYQAAAHMQNDEAFSLKQLRDYTKLEDENRLKLDYQYSILPLDTSAAIDREALQKVIDMAALAGIDDLPPLEQIYTDQFKGVGVE